MINQTIINKPNQHHIKLNQFVCYDLINTIIPINRIQ